MVSGRVPSAVFRAPLRHMWAFNCDVPGISMIETVRALCCATTGMVGTTHYSAFEDLWQLEVKSRMIPSIFWSRRQA